MWPEFARLWLLGLLFAALLMALIWAVAVRIRNAGIVDIAWFDASGEQVSTESWNNPEERCLVLRRAGRNDDGTVAVLTAFFNACEQEHTFRMPPPGLPARLLLDSADPDAAERNLDAAEIKVAAHALVLALHERKVEGP